MHVEQLVKIVIKKALFCQFDLKRQKMATLELSMG